MSDSTHLGIDTSRSNHDTVDGETVVLDSETGVLLLLVGNGPLMWERLVAGADRGELLLDVAATYGADAEAEAAAFLDQLVDAGVVITLDGAAGQPTPTPWPDTYAPPRIERYEDIADIMTMDPIHEVDATLGWPHAPARDPRDSA